MRLADRISRLIGQEIVRQQAIERQEQTTRRGLADRRMVDDEEVEILGEIGNRLVGESLQRPLLPAYCNARIEFFEPLPGRNLGHEAAGMVPGDAAQHNRRHLTKFSTTDFHISNNRSYAK
jgi:hypothetical protein